MPDLDEIFPLKTAPIEWDKALGLYRLMVPMLVPFGENTYPVQPQGQPGLSKWACGIAGGPEELDLEFETKRGGAWAVWLSNERNRLWVAGRQGAPLDRVLYFVAARMGFTIAFRPDASNLTVAAALSGLYRVGTLAAFDVWAGGGVTTTNFFI